MPIYTRRAHLGYEFVTISSDARDFDESANKFSSLTFAMVYEYIHIYVYTCIYTDYVGIGVSQVRRGIARTLLHSENERQTDADRGRSGDTGGRCKNIEKPR